MRCWTLLNLVLVSALATTHAQSLDDLNIQIHGFATQGFLYTSNSNNILSTNSSDGSPEWTEAVLNISAQPVAKLSVAVQGHYFLLGTMANTLAIDYAAADYKVNDRFGVRFGKVKTPSGLYNETQDISPSYQWILLPQGVYAIGSRSSQLAHFGGVVYGTLDAGSWLGKVQYRGWGGSRVIPEDDSDFAPLRARGADLPNGTNGIVLGAALHWVTPLKGLMVGASDGRSDATVAKLTYSVVTGTQYTTGFNSPSYFGKFERGKLLVAAEYQRIHLTEKFVFAGFPDAYFPLDIRPWYVLATYRVSKKFTVGTYHSQLIDYPQPTGSNRYSRDRVLSARCDFNSYLYVKAEEHYITGTLNDYDQTHNPAGLKPTTFLTLLKIGVSF